MKTAIIALSVLVPALRAQQFQEQAGLLPGPVVWSEGVIAFDANRDGLLDIVFSNGVGYSGAGTPLAPTLLINHGVVSGLPSFADETASRLPPSLVQQGKGVLACDVDRDDDDDLVFANAFQSQPRLLLNDGIGNFTDATATRFPALTLNSFGAACGDVDNDGDLDLVFADAGPSAFAPPGGTALLFLNDGSGSFTIAPATQFPSVAKVGSQGAQFADLDGDFDLDVVVDGKSAGQQAYLNDGAGNFSYVGDLLPKGTSNTYAIDFGDLDNDDDLDGFYISLSGYNEGTAQNQLVETGTLSFTGSTATLSGGNGYDDNDLAFVDANDDGILDVIVGSLSNKEERLYLNDGTFASGAFVYQPNGFSLVTDSSLDLALADFDGDARYDVVTAQGESGNYKNRYYANTGPADTVPPRIGRVERAPATLPVEIFQGSGLVRRAWIQDAVVQDGRTFAVASLKTDAVKRGYTVTLSVPMRASGGCMYREIVHPPAGPEGLVGMDVTYVVHAADAAGNASDSAPSTFRICGAENYGAAGGVNHMTIAATPDPTVGQAMTVAVANGPANQLGLLVVGFGRASWPLAGGTLLVDPTQLLTFRIALDGNGAVSIPFTVPADAGLTGVMIDLQAAASDPAAAQHVALSVGLEVAFCGV
ncbi:MAG: VCBS repeat-containing protein [Planctomycetota bacterium]